MSQQKAAPASQPVSRPAKQPAQQQPAPRGGLFARPSATAPTRLSASATAIAACAQRLRGARDDYDGLLELIGPARFVLLGEASHGTHEFYHERARITGRLIAECGFDAVAVEADWPHAYRVNRYVRADGSETDARSALDGFARFPAWMWRNTDVLHFVQWLRRHNDALAPAAQRVGFYGLDLYSMFSSIAEVLLYLDRVDPNAARRARTRYACFEQFQQNSQRYGYAAGLGLSPSCEGAVVAQLRELHEHFAGRMGGDDIDAGDAYFYAQQNARLVVNAEHYYRTMFHGRVASWNLRDRHMMETLQALEAHLGQAKGAPAKLVVWAHNSHLGDARATDASGHGEWNIGQLMRQRYGKQAVLVGMTTYDGSVTAASDWDGPARRKRVRPALPGSYEHLLHASRVARFVLPLQDNLAARALGHRHLERAIGVIYLPETERRSHYFYAHLPQQFDAIVHIDHTHALVPLEPGAHWHAGEAPETFPAGL